MKTLKTMVMAVALLLVCVASQTASATNNSRLTKDEAMNSYLNAVVHGKVEGVGNAIDIDAQFSMKRGNNVSALSRDQVLSSLNANENVEQGCQCTKTTLQDDADMSVLKVDMKFDGFTRTDVITAQRAGNGWKITKVETSFA